MLKITRHLLKSFSKKKIFLLFLLILLSSVLEILSVTSIIPLISSFATENSSQIFLYEKIKYFINFKDINEYIIFLSIIILIIFTVKFFISSFVVIFSNNFLTDVRQFLSRELINRYLSQNYIWHCQNNKSRFLNILTEQTTVFTLNYLQAVLHLTVELFLLFAIIFVLFFINSKLFLIVTVFSLFIIFLINKFSKKHSYFLGKERERNANFIFKYLNENLSGIKEIIIYSGQKIITNKYLDNLLKLSKSIAKHLNYIEIGRYGLELLGVTLVFLILIIMSIDETISKTNIIETIGVYVLALFRILPLLNRLSTYTQRIRNGHISAEKIYSFINSTEITGKERKNVNLEKKIELKNVSFKYPDQKNLILDNINLEIKKNELIGIFGKSGGGKTTLTNILMGLLQPLSGNIYIDGKDMVKNNLSFSHQSSFLSQDLFSIDSSIINNITLTDEKINISNLKYALRNSMLKTDIAYKRLNLKMNIGDSVKKISGGQLQRINIARALYRRPTLLIMDEPTSALDRDGQKAFSEILLKLKSSITTIVISHDQNLLKNFDKIYNLNNEKLELVRNI